LLLSIIKLSLYDGTGDDMHSVGFKTNNIALKNTPKQNSKEFKTRTENQAKKIMEKHV
jgi:hypothetical protein